MKNYDLIEKLMELPVQIGDHIWSKWAGYPIEYTITGISFGDVFDEDDEINNLVKGEWVIYCRNGKTFMMFSESGLGKNYFLTKEDLEASFTKSERVTI